MWSRSLAGALTETGKPVAQALDAVLQADGQLPISGFRSNVRAAHAGSRPWKSLSGAVRVQECKVEALASWVSA